MIKTEILTITPTEAKRMLEGNTNNRKLSKDRVAQLAGIIKDGRWAMNGESIKFNGKQLLDGQHRLHAIVEANKPIKTLVVRGLDAGVFATLDQQKKRGAPDALGISGEVNTANLAAAIRVVHDIAENPGKWKRSSTTLPNSYFMDFLRDHPGIRDSVLTIHSRSKITWKLVGVSIGAGLHYLLGLSDESKRDEFFADLENGSNYGADDPLFVLRQRLIENSTAKFKMDRTTMMALIIKAWNARFQGKRVRSLKWAPSQEDFPTIATELE